MSATPPSGPQSGNGAPVAGGSAPESGDVGHLAWRRLSPRMLVIHPVQELLRAAPALIGILVAGTSSGNGSLWSLAGVGVVVVLGVLRWFATAYRITPDQVQIRRGLLRRRTLTVPRDRVRSVDISANVMHRLLGLARVNVGTGRSDRKNEGALRLDALRVTEASRLREELLHRGSGTNLPAAPAASSATPPASGTTSGAPVRPGAVGSEVELARLAPGWIRYAPFTLSGIVTVGVVTGFLARLASEAHVDLLRFGPLRDVTGQLGRASSLWLVVIALGLAFLAVVAASSTAGYVLAFWGFRLSRDTTWGTLHVTRGLVSTRAITIEERRLRGIELSEPLLLRAVRGARCIAIVTGLRVGRGAERGGSLLLPAAPRREAQRVAAEVLRGQEEPVISPLTSHGPRALRRRYSRALTVCTLVVVALALLWWQAPLLPTWTWELSLLLFPAGVITAADRYRNLGHAAVGGTLVSSRGSLVRRRCVLFSEGIIGWNLRRSFFQRRAGLATLTATTAAGRQRYPVQDVCLGEALRIAEEAVPGLLSPFLVSEVPEEERQGPGSRPTSSLR